MLAMEKIKYYNGIRTWWSGNTGAIISAKMVREGLPEEVRPKG